MDLIKLDGTTFLPALGGLIEGYSSLIWTERYLQNGEFELTTYDITETKNALPEDTLLSIRNSREVMIVESRTISWDQEGKRVLVVRGRTLETFLEQRVIDGISGKAYRLQKQYSSVGAAEILIWNALCNPNSGPHSDVVSDGSYHDPNDRIFNTRVSESTTPGQPAKTWHVETGYVYPKVLEILASDDLGIRTIRPRGNPAVDDPQHRTIISVATDGTGIITRTDTTNVKKLLFDIYDGVDRTTGQTAREPVVLSYDDDDLINPEYLWTKANKKNIGYVTSNIVGGYFYFDQGAEDKVGLARRVLWIDISDKAGDDPDSGSVIIGLHGEPIQTGPDFIDTYTLAEQRSQSMVKRRRNTFYFNGEANPDSKYAYKTDFYLGDKITLMAGYDTTETAIVSEYIRTEDENGDKGYPTLVINS